ncbi:DUF2975 domain-containing protein [Clostridium sporogenes]|uniref:DUF2975 domain-containing protein n=1 Tax=Clostridium sporogenes TaxID=1509 RepID=A0AAE4FI09_CLOSG|nr:DUF2975 domain-containing protein [Clostridium sporogenes]MDS1002208.1 DUF2975 domain-containing protein [Clostridium sporogenes]
MKQNFSIKFIKLLLILTIFFCTAMLFTGIFASRELHGNVYDFLVHLIINVIYLIISWDLLKIVSSIHSTLFTSKNVKSFKIIGYLMILLSIIDGIVNFKKKSNIEIISTGYGSLKGSCIFYLILGLLSLVLAEIFKKAVQIKDENDLTI